MALPEGLELVNDALGKPFITLRNYFITFSKLAIEYLDYAPYIHMYINKEKRIAVIQACEHDAAAIPFFKEPEKGKQILVRIMNSQTSHRLMDVAGVDDCGKGIRYYGEYLPEDHAIVFDLSKGE